MLRDGLYHKQVRMPQLDLPEVELVLNYTYHAIEASRRDRYGKVNLPETILFKFADIIEAEVVNGRVYKVVARIHHDQRNDLVLVIVLDGMRVKTVWLNRKNDTHKTLDRSKYNK